MILFIFLHVESIFAIDWVGDLNQELLDSSILAINFMGNCSIDSATNDSISSFVLIDIESPRMNVSGNNYSIVVSGETQNSQKYLFGFFNGSSTNSIESLNIVSNCIDISGICVISVSDDGGSTTIKSCTFQGNFFTAVFMYLSAYSMDNCTFANITGNPDSYIKQGSALYEHLYMTSNLTNTLFENVDSKKSVAPVFFEESCPFVFDNVVFNNNKGTLAGAVLFSLDNVIVMRHCIFNGNELNSISLDDFNDNKKVGSYYTVYNWLEYGKFGTDLTVLIHDRDTNYLSGIDDNTCFCTTVPGVDKIYLHKGEVVEEVKMPECRGFKMQVPEMVLILILFFLVVL